MRCLLLWECCGNTMTCVCRNFPGGIWVLSENSVVWKGFHSMTTPWLSFCKRSRWCSQKEFWTLRKRYRKLKFHSEFMLSNELSKHMHLSQPDNVYLQWRALLQIPRVARWCFFKVQRRFVRDQRKICESRVSRASRLHNPHLQRKKVLFPPECGLV